MKTMKASEAAAKAIEKGATADEIAAQVPGYERQVKSVPFKNMITALHMSPWLNDKAAWIRLAAALQARNNARRKAKA